MGDSNEATKSERWIRMRYTLREDVKVLAIAMALCDDNEFRQWMGWDQLPEPTENEGSNSHVLSHGPVTAVTLGGLYCVWSHFDMHTEHGISCPCDLTMLCVISGVPGFGEAMYEAGWLEFDPDTRTVILPDFDDWNDPAPKRKRGKTPAERKRKSRAKPKEENKSQMSRLVTFGHAMSRQEEEEEEDKKGKSPIVPPSGTSELKSGNAAQDGKTPREAGTNPRATGTNPRTLGKNPRATKQIEAIHDAYPRKIGRGKAITAIRKALTKISFESLLTAVQAYASNVEHKLGTDEERFIPHPATWFNGERWADGPPVPEKQSWAERNAVAADSEASKGAPVASNRKVGQPHHGNAPRSLKRQTPTKSQGANK